MCVDWNVYCMISSIVCTRISLHIWRRGMAEAALQNAIQRFRFDRFDAGADEWDYYIQRFETELALHNLNSSRR